MRLSILHIYAMLALLVACAGDREDCTGEVMEMRHASLLALVQGDSGVVATIRNPWDTARVLQRYEIRRPLRRAVVTTSVHCSLISELGAYDCIAGVCDAEYIYLDTLRRDVAAGRIADLGSSMAPDIERLIDLKPDAILVSPFENSGSYGKLGKLGVPIIQCADYMETSALGRAEWMRFYGMLFGRGDVADSLFCAVEARYDSLKTLAERATERPKVVAETKTGATWYVAGAGSTMGQLYADAGAEYAFSDEPSSGSVPYDPEVVFDRAQDADIWLLKYSQATDKTLAELAADWPNNARMQAFRTGNVFACNLARIPFFEETPFHPDLLLRDFLSIFHPGLLPAHSPRYFKRME